MFHKNAPVSHHGQRNRSWKFVFIIFTFLVILCSCGELLSAQTPDLTVLDNYPNPSGTTCGLDGKKTATAEKKKWNRLKNRFRVGDSTESITFKDILKLRPYKNGSKPSVENQNHLRYVSFVGYVRAAYPGGTAGESCNCGANGRKTADVHIDVVIDPQPDEDDPSGRGVIVVEVTERTRRLAALGLLDSNIGSDWTASTLKEKIRGRWVRFSGWLYYDDEHHLESWRVDPQNKVGRKNWRATAWEVHPVMGIEVLPGKPDDLDE